MKNDKTQNLAQISKIQFPDWQEISYQTIKSRCQEINQDHLEYSRIFLEKSEKIKSIGFGDHIAQTMQLALDLDCFNQNEVNNYNKVNLNAQIEEINEFYSVFELNKGEFTEVDSKIIEVLGIEPNDFSILNLFAINQNSTLYHPEDVSQVIRWAGIAYAVLGFPGIEIHPNREYYKVSFRLRTSSSKLEYLRKKETVVLEKKCFLKISGAIEDFKFPRYHFDKWNVFPSDNFEFVQPYFVSNNSQSEILNTLAFLMNAYLLDISPKYLLMLDARRKFDRNKEIANCINSNLERITNTDFKFTENQIADYFAKTIRAKITQMAKKWDKINDYGTVVSEQQAINIAQKFGLLPIPENIAKDIFLNISCE